MFAKLSSVGRSVLSGRSSESDRMLMMPGGTAADPLASERSHTSGRSRGTGWVDSHGYPDDEDGRQTIEPLATREPVQPLLDPRGDVPGAGGRILLANGYPVDHRVAGHPADGQAGTHRARTHRARTRQVRTRRAAIRRTASRPVRGCCTSRRDT